MSTPQLPPGEAKNIPQLVRQSAKEIVGVLTESANTEESRYPLGRVVGALAITEGTATAHTFARTTIEDLDLPPSETFGVWVDLYAQGDQEALPQAREAATLAGEEKGSIWEDILLTKVGSTASAERLVDLVQAGDAESLPIARNMSKDVPLLEKTALFGRLYQAGDAESLGLALESALQTREYINRTDDTTHYRTGHAVARMAEYAVQTGKTADALALMAIMPDKAAVTSLHAELWRQGRTESLKEVLAFIKHHQNKDEAVPIVRQLARAGHTPSVETIKWRMSNRDKKSSSRWPRRRRDPLPYGPELHLRDLVTLHDIGVEGADRQVAEIVQTSRRPGQYLHYLGEVGLLQEQIDLATKLFRTNPCPLTTRNLLEVRHDNQLWQAAFRRTLYERKSVLGAAIRLAIWHTG